jgi:hypothetical protein
MRQRHSLCGIPIEIESNEPVRWRLAASSLEPELRISVQRADRIPAPCGTRLFDGPHFSIWESGDRLAIHLGESAQAEWLRGKGRIRVRRRDPEPQLFEEVLPELIAVHACPASGRAYLHAAGTLGEAGVQLFLGPSGRGKSTAARLLASLGAQVPFVADRCAAWIDGRPRVAAAPWHGGDEGAGAPQELRALFALDRDGEHGVRRLSGLEALARLTANAFLPRWWPEGMDAALSCLERLAAAVPVYRLSSEPDRRLVERVHSAAEV